MSSEQQLPPPLVPAEVNLQDFAFMPLDVRRLRDSALIAERQPEEILAALLLWCAAWHQVPSSSLPDDDKQLSQLAGYGRAVTEFRRIRDGAMHRWIKCTDGRWYHPVVAEKAAEGWNAKLKEQHRRACDNVRKMNKDRQERSEPLLPRPPAPVQLVAVDSGGITVWRYGNSSGKDDSAARKQEELPPEDQAGSAGNGDDVRRNSARKGQGREGTGKGQGSTGGNSKPQQQVPPAGSKTEPPPPERHVAIAVLLRKWETDRGKASKIMSSNPYVLEWARLGVTDQRLREAYDIAVSDRTQNGENAPINAGFLDIFVKRVCAAPTAAPGSAPDAPKPWHQSAKGIEAKGTELGITQGRDEPFPTFKARVYKAAGITRQDLEPFETATTAGR